LKTGYVISGIILVSLATVFAFIAGIMAVIVYFSNLASTVNNSAVSPFMADYQNALILTLVVGTLFYIVGGIFLWQGFKTQPVYYPPRYPVVTHPQSYLNPYNVSPSVRTTVTSPSSPIVESPYNVPSTIQQQQSQHGQLAGSVATAPLSSSPSNSNLVFANCPKCNARIPAEAKFCPSCGTDLRVKSPVDPVIPH
jgi:ribosomal protein L40E